MAGLVKVTLFLFSKCSKSSKISLTNISKICRGEVISGFIAAEVPLNNLRRHSSGGFNVVRIF
jgi:hypothetical protein